eukprot:SAG31_NODE_799_length_12017_cov_5.478436_3_plen_91_part_00
MRVHRITVDHVCADCAGLLKSITQAVGPGQHASLLLKSVEAGGIAGSRGFGLGPYHTTAGHPTPEAMSLLTAIWAHSGNRMFPVNMQNYC